jgi:hypothetical protein
MRLLLLFGIFILSLSIKAQSVNGIVTDVNEKTLKDAMVYNFFSKTHAHTDTNGKFVLENTKSGDSLQVSKEGYVFKNIKVLSNEILSIVLDEKPFLLEEVTITNDLKYLNTISKIDLEIQPISNSQDLMRKVPGLFIGQHAGGGKAEQIFLRGFDCDHGTDINVR